MRVSATHYARATATSLALLLLCTLATAMASVPEYQDSGGYPATWPGDVQWNAYTSQGETQSDLEGQADPSAGSVPQNSTDFSSGWPAGSEPSFSFYSNGTVLFIRLRIASCPLAFGGKQPFESANWNVLIDTDFDGYKEFAITVQGYDGGTQPDDIVVSFGDSDEQHFDPDVDDVWRQDCSGTSDGVDGGDLTDIDSSPYVWDYTRTRVVQINQTLTSGSKKSEYFLDFQVPYAAIDSGIPGGPNLQPGDLFAMIATSANSNSNPLQKDILYNGEYDPDGGPLPFGDPTDGTDTPIVHPIVIELSTTTCPSPIDILSQIQSALIVQNISGVQTVTDSLSNVRFEYFYDIDSNGVADDAQSSWTAIGDGSRTTSLGEFELPGWDTTTLLQGLYFIRVVATDTSPTGPYTTESDAQEPEYSNIIAILDNQCGIPFGSVAGYVFGDQNHNAIRDAGETGIGTNVWVKAVPSATPSGPAVRMTPANATTGEYTLHALGVGSYDIILTATANPSDVTPILPTGFAGTLNPLGRASNVSVTAGNSTEPIDFGLYYGSRLTALVFRDDGSGGGTANDGLINGAETGLSGVTISALAGVTHIDSAVSDASGNVTLWLTASLDGTSIAIVEANPVDYLSTGGSAGNTSGSYDRASDSVTFTMVSGTGYTGVSFGDVPPPTLTASQNTITGPGIPVFFPHHFTATTAGSVSFSTIDTPSPALPGWSSVIYLDSDGDGAMDPGALLLNTPVAVTAGDDVYVIVKVYIAPGAPLNAQNITELTAHFELDNATPALSVDLTNVDVTTVASTPGLGLTKAVDKAQALPGEILTYTIEYENLGTGSITEMVIIDATPFATTFVSHSEGPLPENLTGVTVVAPAAGETGAVQWTFEGTLLPGRQGTLTLQVRIND